MLKNFNGPRKKTQRGDLLLDALIAIFLTAILVLGLTYVASKVLVQQRSANAMDLVMLEMRNQLESKTMEDLCSNPPVLEIKMPGQTHMIQSHFECERKPVTVSVTGGVPSEEITSEEITSAITNIRFYLPKNSNAVKSLVGEKSFNIE